MFPGAVLAVRGERVVVQVHGELLVVADLPLPCSQVPLTCDGPAVYLRWPSVYLASPSRLPGAGAAATLFPLDRADVPLGCLPCTSGLTAVYLGWREGLRAGRAGLGPGSSAESGRDRRSRGCGRWRRPAGRLAGTGCPRSLVRVTGQVTPRRRAGAGRSPAAGQDHRSSTGGTSRVDSRYMAHGKGRAPAILSADRTAYRESGSPGILVLADAKKRRGNRIYRVSAISAAAGRSSPHAGFISLPGRIRRGSYHRRRAAAGAGSLPQAGRGWPDGPAAERLARRARSGVPGPRP